jgi:hypothetical protein
MDHGLFLAYDDVRIGAGWSVNVRLHEVCAEGPNQAIARTNVTLGLEAALI